MSVSILVVEDERLVAQDLKELLESMGYQVPAVAYSAEEALEKAAWICPDLVLMDIGLDGERDGIDAAVRMRRDLKLAVVYLTAYADDETLDRAREAEPYGYLVKPYTEADVRSAVTMALYKADADKKLKREKEWLKAVLRSMADGVITADPTGEVTFINPAAEAMTFGKDLHQVLVDPRTGRIDEDRLSELLQEIAAESPDVELRKAQGRDDLPVEYSAAQLKDERGEGIGSVLVLRDVSGRPHPRITAVLQRLLSRREG